MSASGPSGPLVFEKAAKFEILLQIIGSALWVINLDFFPANIYALKIPVYIQMHSGLFYHRNKYY